MKTTTRLLLLLGFPAALACARDTHHWRGPDQNGAFDSKDLPAEWDQEGKNLLWHAEVGSRSGVLVMNDSAYVIGRVGDGEETQERVVCLNLDTGEIRWEHRFNAFLTDIVALRLGWANLCGDPETGHVYAHGVQGMLFCFDKGGKIVWKRSLTEELGRISGYGGRTNTPIVHKNLLILSSLTSGWGPFGKGAHRYWAMDKLTGDIVWWSDPGGKPLDTTYATPVIHDGKLYSAMADGAAVCLNPETGEKIWHTPLSKRGINTSVVVADGKVLVGHGEENLNTTTMGALVALNAADGSEAWRIDGLRAGYASPVVAGDLIYCPDNSANLHCIEFATGKELWSVNYGKEAKGSPVYADGKIYVGEVRGLYHILEVSREGGKVVHSVEFNEENGSPIEVFATPVVAHGRVILPTYWDTYCISTQPADTRELNPAREAVAPSTPSSIVPADIDLKVGEEVTFSVNGDAAWSLKGLQGEIGSDGRFTAVGDRIQAGLVTATVDGKEHSARVRVFPALPYKEDFEGLAEGMPPPGWITSKLKAVVADEDGNKVLRKLADRPAPPFARLRCYMTPPVETGYTVQADMKGMMKNKRAIADMGLINARYLMIALGTSAGRERKLRLTTWAALPRVQVDVPYDWKPGEWYSAKLSVDLVDGKAQVKGKVWPQGEDEPEAWTIEMTDPVPNLEGSPGLYAYSVGITSKTPGTEVFFDNVAITTNGK